MADENHRPTRSVSQLSAHGRGLPDMQNLADFMKAATDRHRELAHKFVDELFDSEGVDGDHNLWRRLLSAMMEDHQRWRDRDKTKKFTPSMSIPLMDMRDDPE